MHTKFRARKWCPAIALGASIILICAGTAAAQTPAPAAPQSPPTRVSQGSLIDFGNSLKK